MGSWPLVQIPSGHAFPTGVFVMLRRTAPARNRLRPRLNLARLEDRLAPALYHVTSLGDSGINTLRGAIIGAGITAGPDTIDFAVTGTITLTTGELSITDALTIIGPGSDSLTVNGNN